MVHSEWNIVRHASMSPLPFWERVRVRAFCESGFEGRGELLKAFQRVLQDVSNE